MLPGMAGAMMVGGGLVAGAVSLAAVSTSLTSYVYSARRAYATIQINNAGDIIEAVNVAGSYDNGDWINPKSGMDQFSVRWTNTSGAINIGTAASWQNLGTSRTFGVESLSGGGNIVVVGKLEIARTDNTAVILATQSGISLDVTSDPSDP